jgi:transposase-like protein
VKILKYLNIETFKSRFGTKLSWYQFLEYQKWTNSYICQKCDHNEYSKGSQFCNKRCSQCGYNESTTTNTLFHKLKFRIDKAFELLYEIATSKKGADSTVLDVRFNVNQKTALLFCQKTQVVMESSEQQPIKDELHVDEFEIGTPQKVVIGRSKKVMIVRAVDQRDGKSGQAYAKVIEDYSSKSLKVIFDTHIKKDTYVISDGWSGYKSLKETFPNLTHRLSNNGESFKVAHILIMNSKNWLRALHSYYNKEYLHIYINECFFRFNRRNHRISILDKIIERCVSHQF